MEKSETMMMTAEIIAAAKAVSEPSLHPWIDLVALTCDFGVSTDDDDAVEILRSVAQSDAEEADWVLPAEQERLDVEHEATEFEVYCAADAAFSADCRRLEAFLEDLDGWDLYGLYYSRSSNSAYYTIQRTNDDYGLTLTIRLSDHPASEWGGWNELTGDYHGRADVEVLVGEDITGVVAAAIAAVE